MADARTYVRVHDGMDEHPKIEGLSDAAFRLLHRCWYYSSRQLTDGRLTDAAWRNRGTVKARRELVDAGLVHLPGHECPHADCAAAPRGHVQMHDYLDHQRSAAEVEELRRKRSDSGRKGGQARARTQASAKQVPEQTSKQPAGKSEVETESETDTSLRSVGRARATRLPDNFVITEEMRAWAHAEGWADRWIDAITERFIDYWRAKPGRDGTKLDWPATWRNWLRREAQNGQAVPAAVGAAAGRPSWEL